MGRHSDYEHQSGGGAGVVALPARKAPPSGRAGTVSAGCKFPVRLLGELRVEPRAKGRKSPSKIPGRFVPLQHSVLTSAGFMSLEHASVRLLIYIAMQYSGHNNGRLVACSKVLRPLGWSSNQTVTRCVRQLVEHGLLFVTRQGGRNHPTWYALTYRPLDGHPGYEPQTTIAFAAVKGAYARYVPPQKKILEPAMGSRGITTKPAVGTQVRAVTPAIGAVRPQSSQNLAPVVGDYIEVPSEGSLASGGRDAQGAAP